MNGAAMAKNLVKIICLAITLASCSKAPEPAPQPEPRTEGESIIFPAGAAQISSIKSLVIHMQPVPPTHLNGRVTWDEDKTVRIFTPFAGRVERILAQAGQSVVKGQALAEKNISRLRELEQNGVAARKEVHAAETDQARAAAELARSRRRLELYGGAGTGVDQTYTLTSPVTGVMVEKNINPGQELRPDQMTTNAPPLYTVTDPTTL